MSNYNTQLQSNNTDLQTVLQTLQNKASGSGGTDTSDATATADDILNGKTAYVDGEKVTGTIPTVTKAVPTVTIDTLTGRITATVTQSGGYVTAGTKIGTKQLAFQAAQTITPGTTDKTIAAETYLGGTQTIKGDANLVPSNIVSGKSIFGVVGTASAGDDPFASTAPFTYTVDEISGASYGFSKNSDGYYESQNKGVDNSYAICRVNLTVTNTCDIVFDVINYAESSYDYGLFGNLDNTLALSASADSSSKIKKNFSGMQSASVVNVTYSGVTAGNHYIDIKFIKDRSVNNGNDSVQFKIQEQGGLSQETIDKILAADTDLVAENIKSGVDIFGVTGSYSGEPINLQNKTVTPNTSNQVVKPDSNYDGLGQVTVKGDTNLVASNIKNGTSIFGVTGTYVGSGGSGSGDTDVEDGLITRTITTYSNDRVSSIGYGAFASCTKLTSVSFPNCIAIDDNAFDGCTTLTSVSFPKCTNIYNNAFANCSKLTSVNFPNCTSIGYAAFNQCIKLTSVSFPKCTYIYSYAFCSCSSLTSISFPKCININLSAFYNCTSLTSVSFPECTYICDYAFDGCTTLTSVSFPKCTNIYNNAFANCSKLTSVNFPNCTSIGSYAFANCSKLTSVSFPNCTNINTRAFQSCTSLSIAYFMASSLCTLANSNAFSSTAITSTTGSIYVPASLLASYKAASQWKYFSNRIYGR